MADMDIDAELALLLKEQEAFMKGGKVSSVKLHTAPKKPEPATAAPPTLSSSVMRGGVVERAAPVTRPMPKLVGTTEGFPSTKKQSLFGRRRQQQQQAPPAPAPLRSSAAIPDDIQSDNDAAIAAMSLDEIKKAQSELQASLSPEILDMFRNRAKVRAPTPSAAVASPAPAVAPVVATAPKVPPQRISNDAELASAVQALPDEERAKHEWMTAVPAPATPSAEVRFDFNGVELPTTPTDVLPPSHSGLYHHGDDPDRPGYTVDELLLLARSTVASQRVMACTVLGKVLRRPTALSVGPIALVLRHALDEANQSVLTAGIDALHAALVRFDVLGIQPTGVALTPVDRLGRPNVVRYPEPAEVNDEAEEAPIELKELAQLDAIQALLRTHLPFRLRHLLALPSLANTTSLDQVIDMCIALAMHSRQAATQLLQVKGFSGVLMELLAHDGIDDLLASLETRRKTLVLLRRLCQADAALAAICLQDQLLTATKVALAIRHPGLLPLQLDVIKLWSVCLTYGIDVHSFAYLYPLLCGYPAAGLATQAGDVAIAPWPTEMQLQILEALRVLVATGTEAAQYYRLLPYFVQQAVDLVKASTDQTPVAAVNFLAGAWPIVQHNTAILDIEPYVAVTPLLRARYSAAVATSADLEGLKSLVQYFSALAASPAVQIAEVSLLTLANEMTPSFLRQLAPHRATGISCAAFYAAHASAPVVTELWPLGFNWLASCRPGDEADAHAVLDLLFRSEYPALAALLQALLGPSPNAKETCHVIQPDNARPTLPWPSSWIFSVFSRIAASELSAAEWQTLLAQACGLLLQLEATAPQLLATTATAQKLVHLAHVYLLETDSWLAPAVAEPLQALVSSYVAQLDGGVWYEALDHVVQSYKQCEAGKEAALVQSFVESLVHVFCGASYGDRGLSAVLMLCLLPSVPVSLRVWLWTELRANGSLALVVVPSTLVEPLLAPTDPKLVECYVSSLTSQALTASRGHDLYTLAVAHVARYCLGGTSVELPQRLQQTLLRVLQTPSPDLVRDVLTSKYAVDADSKLQWCGQEPAFVAVQAVVAAAFNT
ncbi:RNA polymerase II-associated protein 1 [Achlya hypogyna]|uniref:RNA polymerase II-associated protein 1 n=1 Tax=Achlya hypogyna TaxID=1202772 RepID=A0A1V9YHQ2_ACHHY|nr:RNA polymerase II-associated protein 1 [Achlya hypogyna]